MNGLQIFNNKEFGEIRGLEIDGQPYFVGKDIASILGYSDVNKAVKRHVDKEDLKVCSRKAYADLYPNLWNNENDFANKILINESGLYALIFGSKLSNAKQFKRWITSEVLPSIRKYGGYGELQLSKEDTAILDIINSNDDLQQALAIRKYKNIISKPLIEEIDKLKELNNKFKTFISKDGLIDVDTFSKVLAIKELGRNNMYKWFRNNKYLMKNNRPYQHYINQGLFKLKNIGYKTNCIGEQIPLFKTYISKKGLGYFLNKFVEDGYINFTNDTENN